MRKSGKPFKGTNKPLRRTRLNTRSKKKREQDRIYMQLRREFLEQHPICAVWLVKSGLQQQAHIGAASVLALAVGPRSTEIHHRKGRGKYYLDTSTWEAVSAEGHRYIHDNPAWAESVGLLSTDRNRRPFRMALRP